MYSFVVMTKFKMLKKVSGLIWGLCAKNHMHISGHTENICNVSKRLVNNCWRSCTHKVPKLMLMDGQPTIQTKRWITRHLYTYVARTKAGATIVYNLFDPCFRTVWTSSRRKMFENSLYSLHINFANKNQLRMN